MTNLDEYFSNPYNLLLGIFFTFEEDGDYLEHKWLELDECIYTMSLEDLVDVFLEIGQPSKKEIKEFKTIMLEIKADEECKNEVELSSKLQYFLKKYDI